MYYGKMFETTNQPTFENVLRFFFSKLFLTTLNSMLLEEDFGKLLLLLLAHELRLLLFKLGNLGMTSVLGIPILHKDSH